MYAGSLLVAGVNVASGTLVSVSTLTVSEAPLATSTVTSLLPSRHLDAHINSHP
jgi:hypothetical protein